MWRQKLTRAKVRKSPERISLLAGELKNSRKELRIAIGKTKREAWDELLEGLNRDPWGRLYKTAMNKIRPENMDICRKLPGKTIDDILGKLFPQDRGTNKYKGSRSRVEKSIPLTMVDEVEAIIQQTIKKSKKAPGPDGIQARLVAEAHHCAEPMFRGLYDGCLRTGKFPERWKIARMVLLKKEGKPEGSSYRSPCVY